MERLTATLLLASLIMVSLISMKIIENRDSQITKLNTKLFEADSINIINISNHRIDSLRNEHSAPYLPTGWEVDSNGIYNLNAK